MNGRVILAIVLVLVLLGVGAGIGVSVYNAGVAQGMVESGKVLAPAAGAVPYPYYYGPFFHPFGFGFGLFGLLIPLFFLFIFFGVLRAIFWRGRWGGHGMHGRWADGVPPMFEEWHRRAHDQPEQPRSS